MNKLVCLCFVALCFACVFRRRLWRERMKYMCLSVCKLGRLQATAFIPSDFMISNMKREHMRCCHMLIFIVCIYCLMYCYYVIFNGDQMSQNRTRGRKRITCRNLEIGIVRILWGLPARCLHHSCAIPGVIYCHSYTHTNAQQLNTEKWKWKNRNHRALCNFVVVHCDFIRIKNVCKTKTHSFSIENDCILEFISSEKNIISSASWLTGEKIAVQFQNYM